MPLNRYRSAGPETETTPRIAAGRIRLGVAVRLLLLAAILVAAYAGGGALEQWVHGKIGPLQYSWSDPSVLAAVALYVVLMALPFVPGMEIGVALMVVLGAPGAVLVYGATLLALAMSFAAGRLVPAAALARFLGWLRLERAQELVQRLHRLPLREKLDLLLNAAPRGWVPFLLRHRYVAIAILFNVPGNTLIGGGGGIGMLGGLSGLFRFPAYLLTVAVAILPIPLAVVVGATLPLPLWLP